MDDFKLGEFREAVTVMPTKGKTTLTVVDIYRVRKSIDIKHNKKRLPLLVKKAIRQNGLYEAEDGRIMCVSPFGGVPDQVVMDGGFLIWAHELTDGVQYIPEVLFKHNYRIIKDL